VKDVELAADIVMGIWLQVIRGTLERRAAPDLANRALTPCFEPLARPRPGRFDGRERRKFLQRA
jgi:hypothetical protein